MPYAVAAGLIETALRALLVAYAPLTAAIATKKAARGGGPAIYSDGEVPVGATMPYLTIGAWTQIPSHNLSPDGTGYGWNCTGQIKAVGQGTEPQMLAILSHVFAALPHGQRLTVTGYGSGWIDEFTLQPALKETLGGVVTVSVPAIVRVKVHD